MERKWIVAGWLDINGFRTWTRRASIAPEQKQIFILEFYKLLQSFVREHKSSWSKYEGDALLCIREFSRSQKQDRRQIIAFVKSMRRLYRKVRRMLKGLEDGPPGVRVRWVDGYVYKIMVLDPNDPKRQRLIPEYVDYCLNTLKGLLEVNTEHDCLAMKGVVRRLGKNAKKIFKSRQLGKPSKYPKGVDKEDIDGLHIFNF